MALSPRVLRAKNSQLLDKLRENQALMKQSQAFPIPVRHIVQEPYKSEAKTTTPVAARQKMLEKRKRTLTSTPVLTPIAKSRTNKKLLRQRTTPQSILKKRELIERNVQVGGKLPDKSLDLTPDQSRGDFLNFSYDASSVKSAYNTRHSSGKKTSFATSPKATFLEKSPMKKKRKCDLENLLKDDGNSRSMANYEKDKTRRSECLASVENTKKNVNRVTFNQTLSKTYSTLYDSQREQAPAPLLGYDWIAGALDNSKASALDKSDAYFDEILSFRKEHKDMCVAKPPADTNGVDEASEKEQEGAIIPPYYNDHTCIHTYVVNDRLFAQPLNKNTDGQSACPVCRKAKKDPTSTSPGYVRVSLPAHHMEAAYAVVPHRRRSFDPSDSCALSQHCMAGMQSSRPSSLKPATSLDMRSAVVKGAKSKFVMDSDVDKIIREGNHHYKTPPRITRSRLAAMDLKSQHRSQTVGGDESGDRSATRGGQSALRQRVANRVQLSRKTRDLLNTSISLRHQAQALERNAHAQPAGKSTRYPAGV